MRNKCSSEREKLVKFEAEVREFAIFLRSLFSIHSIKQLKVKPIFETECFLTCSWRFLRINTLTVNTISPDATMQCTKSRFFIWFAHKNIKKLSLKETTL